MNSDLTNELARIAHECWRLSMERQGWRYGTVFDPAHRTHDALVCFDRLSLADRRQARLAMECEGVQDLLARIVTYPRGPSRPFSIEEMSAGRLVQLEGLPLQIGRVESWDVDERGDLEVIHVRWPDGSVVGYSVQEQVLRRPEERDAGSELT